MPYMMLGTHQAGMCAAQAYRRDQTSAQPNQGGTSRAADLQQGHSSADTVTL
jgi:hypothetical protein